MSSIDPSAGQGRYFSDAENAGEMARLLKQARLTTKGMGGPFPPHLEPTRLRDVLDLACGPGEWVLHVAQAYPHLQVTGVDISETMIHFAHSISAQQPNAHFQRMDIRTPLAFPDNAFDLVNGRFLFGFLTPAAWSALLEECRRVLRPGGMLSLYEAELNLTNSLAFEHLSGFFAQALYRAGQSFSPDGRHLGITLMLGQLLTDAGFEQLQQEFQGQDLSVGTELHQALYEDYQVLFHLVQPFLLQMGVTTAHEFAQLYQQVLHDLRDPQFRSLGFGVRAWGSKPA